MSAQQSADGGTPSCDVLAVIEDALAHNDIPYTRKAINLSSGDDIPGIVAELPGTNKLKTTVLISVGNHNIRFEAFVCRKVDENFEAVFKFLLRRNRRISGVAYTLDKAGDIYLVGRMPISSVSEANIDLVLGQILDAADGDFNTLLELGFSTSIKKEYQWRISRGESLANLKPFSHLFAEFGDNSSGTESGASKQ